MQESKKDIMSIQFNMTNAQELAQEGFVWGISNSDDFGGGLRRIEKQSPPSQPSNMLETQWGISNSDNFEGGLRRIEKQSFPSQPSHMLETQWGISNSDDFGGGLRRIEKQSLPSQPSHLLETQTAEAAKRKRKAKLNGKNHAEESHDHEIHIWTERERRKKMRDMFSKLHALLPQLPPKADKSTIVDEAVSSIKSLERTLEKLQIQKLEKLQYSSASNTTPTTTFAYAPSSSSSPTTLLTPISNHPQILTVGATAADSYSREAFLADQISSSSAAAVNLPYPCNDPIVAFDTWSSRNVVLNICGNEAFFNFCCPKDKSGVFTAVCYLFEKYNIEVLFANVSSNVFRSTYMIQAQVKPSYERQLLGDGFGVGEIFKQAAQELVLYVSSL